MFITILIFFADLGQADKPKTLRALKVVAIAISSGVLFRYAAIISTVTGSEQGSFLWKVQYLCRNMADLKFNNFNIINKPIKVIEVCSSNFHFCLFTSCSCFLYLKEVMG